MSEKRLSMRKIRELMRLKYEFGRSHREIAASLGVANSTVSDYVRRAVAAALSWPLPEGLDDAALEAALFPALPPSRVPRPEPDWQYVHRELQRHKGVTLRLLWLEYTGQSKRTATSTAGSATATRCGGGTSMWSCGRSTGRARRRSSTTRARSSRSWTGAPARCAMPWSSSGSWPRRTTRSWT